MKSSPEARESRLPEETYALQCRATFPGRVRRLHARGFLLPNSRTPIGESADFLPAGRIIHFFRFFPLTFWTYMLILNS